MTKLPVLEILERLRRAELDRTRLALAEIEGSIAALLAQQASLWRDDPEADTIALLASRTRWIEQVRHSSERHRHRLRQLEAQRAGLADAVRACHLAAKQAEITADNERRRVKEAGFAKAQRRLDEQATLRNPGNRHDDEFA